MHLQHVLQGLDISSLRRPPNLFIIANEDRLPNPLDREATMSVRSSDLLVLIDEGIEVLQSLEIN